jgi:glutamine amidotransferase
MSQRIAIVDFGMGNLRSVERRLDRLGTDARVTADPDDLAHADKLVLPGVGHFGQAMQNLRALGLLDPLRDAAVNRRVPVLGICLGMQLMGNHGEEGAADGLGWIDADVTRLEVSDPHRFKVPHIGWSRVYARRPSPLLEGLAEGAEFYFVHSFRMNVRRAEFVLCDSEYGASFASGVQSENLFGVQFHPEKSHAAGERLLENFVRL